MRYLSYPSLAAVGLCVAFSANAQDARDPIDEALAVDEQESGVLAPRDAAAAAQIEPRSGEDQGFGSSVYTVGPISLEGLRELSVADFVDIVQAVGMHQRFAIAQRSQYQLGCHTHVSQSP